MATLDQLDTIVIVMMENRSFDHVLGYLRLPQYGNRTDIDGLFDLDTSPHFSNIYDHQIYRPFEAIDGKLIHDLPHARSFVDTQLAMRDGHLTMGGFVQAYADFTNSLETQPPVMGYMTPRSVPMSNFLARNYGVCDRWFAPLPADTQPNRAMAFTGSTLIDDTMARIIPTESLVLDWLDKMRVRWRVYHSGLSFFMLFGAFDHVLGANFRNFFQLPGDFQHEPDTGLPQVIFIEPDYGDSPVHFGAGPNDNHPPLPMAPGENFLRDVYAALSGNAERWKRTLLIVTYDEHGGFFDHVAPPQIVSTVPPNAQYIKPFGTAGVRVPALLVSPRIPAGAAVHDTLDHTSILQLLATKFGGGPHDYSDNVSDPKTKGISNLADVINRSEVTRTDIPIAPATAMVTSQVLRATSLPVTPNQVAFSAAANTLMVKDRQLAMNQFPELAHLQRYVA